MREESEPRFEADPAFRPVSGRAGDFLVGPAGDKVRIDGFGLRLWAALPGTVAEIAARLDLEAGDGRNRVEDFLTLFAAARLVRRRASGPGLEAAAGETAGATGRVPALNVSAVIVTRNGAAHIRDCLSSLLRQDRPLREILVVDNGSSDGTPDIIRLEYPGVTILDPGRNLYYPGGLNHGILRAAGEAILVLNDDVELEPDAVGLLAERLRRDASAAAAVPELRLFHLRGFLNGIGNHVRGSSWGSDCFVGCVDVGQFRGLREVPSACVSAALVRKEAWRNVGPFEAGYLAYYEDVDWSFRARLAGWTIAAVPEAVVYHKFSAYWKNMEGKLKLAARNRMRFILRVFRGPSLKAFFKSYLKEDLINVLSLLRKRRFSMVWAYARAYAGLVLLLPGIADARRDIHRKSKPGISIEDILALNPVRWTCMGPDGVPKLDAEAYVGYYREILRVGK